MRIAILGGGLNQVRNAADASEATLHAQSLLDELGVLEPILPGTREGESDDGRYRWTMEISEAEDPAPVAAVDPAAVPEESVGLQIAGEPLLYRIQLDMAWGEDGEIRSLRFTTLRAREAALLSTSFVLVETYALTGRRLGLDAARRFREDFAPLLQVVWVDQELHEAGLDVWLERRRRSLSLVDAVSFVVMRQQRLTDAFAFDPHFEQEGFRLVS